MTPRPHIRRCRRCHTWKIVWEDTYIDGFHSWRAALDYLIEWYAEQGRDRTRTMPPTPAVPEGVYIVHA